MEAPQTFFFSLWAPQGNSWLEDRGLARQARVCARKFGNNEGEVRSKRGKERETKGSKGYWSETTRPARSKRERAKTLLCEGWLFVCATLKGLLDRSYPGQKSPPLQLSRLRDGREGERTDTLPRSFGTKRPQRNIRVILGIEILLTWTWVHIFFISFLPSFSLFFSQRFLS